jgi:hypothetical protein
MQYYFHSEITDAEKIHLKTITSQIKDQVGIYMDNVPVKTYDAEYITNYICTDMFNYTPLFVFSISREVLKISEHLESIIKFIIRSNDTNKKFHIAVTVIKQDHYNVIIFPEWHHYHLEYIHSYKGFFTDFDTPYSYSGYYTYLTNKSEYSYVFEILNRSMISVNKSKYIWRGHQNRIEPPSDNITSLWSPYKLVLLEPSYNLTDQYNEELGIQKESKDDNEELGTQKESKDDNNCFGYVIKSNMKVKVINSKTDIIINCLKCPDFGTLDKYLSNEFGKGRYTFEINFETGEKSINYEIE